MKQRSIAIPEVKKLHPLEFPAAVATATTESDIRRRAYEIYEKRGSVDGHAIDDWLQAEREMLNARGAAA